MHGGMKTSQKIQTAHYQYTYIGKLCYFMTAQNCSARQEAVASQCFYHHLSFTQDRRGVGEYPGYLRTKLGFTLVKSTITPIGEF